MRERGQPRQKLDQRPKPKQQPEQQPKQQLAIRLPLPKPKMQQQKKNAGELVPSPACGRGVGVRALLSF
ncbi:MAG: hypothetical protein DI584_06375 [Stenotrophomonas sp.]|jgi:hypothetical protein|nr:MAG: hypothetical protein DI584_06375 [Stenotrophomonas sp.]